MIPGTGFGGGFELEIWLTICGFDLVVMVRGEKERTVVDLEGVITVKVPPSSCSGDICLFRQVQQGR